MALFDSIIGDLKDSFGLSSNKAGGLVAVLVTYMTNSAKGGFGGFLDKFRGAGLGDLVNSWVRIGDNTPLTGAQVEAALGSDAVTAIAKDAGLARSSASSILGGIIPSVVDRLTPDGVVPDNESLMSRIGSFLSDWAGVIGGVVAGGVGAAAAVAGDVSDRVGNAAGAVGNRISNTAERIGDTVDDAASSSWSFLKWLLPLLLLGLLLLLGFWFCRGSSTPVVSNVNTHRTPTSMTTPAAAVSSSFKIEAKDGKYFVSGVVADQKTADEIKAKLDASWGAGNVDYAGLKVDSKATPFGEGWWPNFGKILPTLKDWKTGVLAFAGNAITEAVGLPAAALDQLKSAFSGWKMPDAISGAVQEVSKTLSEVPLPEGPKLSAYPGGIEDQLVKFIQSEEYKTATNEQLKTKWFNFDDLNFVFGKTELAPESKRQMDNIVAILKAFPTVKIKIGGYTDKKGDDAANLKLSDGRAKTVQAALQKAGVGAQVTGAEGYGEKHATVDENASDDARKIDRKTAIRLAK